MKNKLLNLMALCCLLLLVGCQSPVKPEGIQIKIARVVSGQSFEVMGIGEQSTLVSRVRMIGIDAPDLQQQPWGGAAKDWLEATVGDQPVMLEFDVESKDKSGRTLAYVWKNGDLLNEKLVQQGYALFVPRSPNYKYDKRLERAQEWARLMGQGIWNPDKPLRQTPAEFRRQNR